jgi:peptidase M23-like protein
MTSDYIWPLSKSSIPNEMNTSFGPRINTNRWDFHDGIDLPAKRGTKIYAVRDGTVLFADEKNKDGYSSRHIVLEVHDPNDGLIYLVHLHLDSIDGAVTPGVKVVQGQVMGTVGDDGTSPGNTHLHLEFLQGTSDPKAQTSRHPLRYLPYSDTANFTAPVADRFNRFGPRMAARLLFGACNKSEGDLLKVEVDLLTGAAVLDTRVVDFHDHTTINKKRGNSDTKIFKNDIGVEGYQKSHMNDPKRTRTDLRYGILLRNLECDTLIARVFDVGGNSVTSAPILVPNQTATDEFVDFENGAMPPAGWKRVTSTTGSGTTVANDASAAHSGSRGMLCVDASTTENTQRAGIEFALPAGRFEWIAEGWFNPMVLDLTPNGSIHLLRFLSDEDLSVAARIFRHEGGLLLAGIVAKDLDGDLKVANSSAIISPGVWRRWRLRLRRIGTRESTAVLYLDEDGKMEEQDRLDWDSTVSEPTVLRAGIGFSSARTKATVLTDELRVSESPIS